MSIVSQSLSLNERKFCWHFKEADRIDMRFFRYGGVNVTYFLPKSSYRMDSSIDPATTDRLSLPSV